MRITRLRLEHFKAFNRFSLQIGTTVFLVGPNNAGKSTLVSAIRAAAGMLAIARRRQPTRFTTHREAAVWAHELDAESLGLVTENLRHQFREDETTLAISTDTGLQLAAVWPAPRADAGDDGNAFFYLTNRDGLPLRQPAQVRRLAGAIGIVPGLYPVNRRERVLDEGYLREHFEGRRASQHARNHIHLIAQQGELKEFREFALEWLPEITSLDVETRPGEHFGESELDVFVQERGDRTAKELFWSGDGLQIFVQVLTHLWRLRGSEVVVLDEPDLYLHANLQRRLVQLLQSTQAQTITATHSPEMLAEASADTVIWVDKSRRKGIRRPDASTLQDLSAQIGSAFNLRLAAALRAKAVVFVEGDDMTLVRLLARKAGAPALAGERGCAVIQMKGFDHSIHVEPFHWFVNDFLQGSVETFVILDRDYRSDAEIGSIESRLAACGVRPHVWRRKEIESYLLELGPLARVSGLEKPVVSGLLAVTTQELVDGARARFLGSLLDAPSVRGLAKATIIEKSLGRIDEYLADPEWRLQRLPAKEILSALNRRLQETSAATVSPVRLAREIRETELSAEVVDLLREIEASLGGG